ncbi:hypothetical protein EI94DRAFT_1833782 [Lactarius quietus]|nr:hypothetical protein EI94DRAFT_1833782 [Lactarius quietus]
MPFIYLFRSIAHRISPAKRLAKRVEASDQRLKDAEALLEKHRAVMNPNDHERALSFLQSCGDLRYGLETKRLLARIEQARLYGTQVDKTVQHMQHIQDAVKDVTVRP